MRDSIIIADDGIAHVKFDGNEVSLPKDQAEIVCVVLSNWIGRPRLAEAVEALRGTPGGLPRKGCLL